MTQYENVEFLDELRELQKTIKKDPKKAYRIIDNIIYEIEENLIKENVCPICGDELDLVLEEAEDCGTSVIGKRCTCCGKEFK